MARLRHGPYRGTLKLNPLTGDRDWRYPDKSGTFACLSDLPGGGVATQAQEFDGPTTTTPALVPQGCTRVRGRLIGAGGGGGSGRRGPAGIIRGGGGGGGGGGTTDFDLNLDSIATALGTTRANLYWSISVPAGGAGAVGPTADATNGGIATNPTATLLKFQNGPGGAALTYAQAFGGNGGGGGTATAGGIAGAGGAGTYAGGGGTAGGVPSPSSSAAQPVGAAGGTGGAGFSAANATGNGANGGASGNSVSTVGAGGGLAPTAAGSTTNAPNHGVAGAPGGGGAGGRSDGTVISAAKGSNGYRGGGGGGGAATLNGSAFAPSGGDGGNGYAQLIWSSYAAALTPLYWQGTFTPVIPLSGFTTVPLYAIAANVQFELLTPLTSNRPGAKCVYYLQANGVNVVYFLASQAALFKEIGSSQGWDGRNGVVNRIEFEWDGTSCWYSITQQKSAAPTWLPVALTFPTRTAAISQSGNSYSSTTAAAWSAQMTSAQTIPAGKAGRVVVRVDSFCLIGFNDSSAAQAYTNFEYQAWEELNGTITTQTIPASSANDGVTRGTNLDLYIRLTRNSGGTVTVERSENGTAWTLSRTFANTNTGALFVAADITGPYDSNARQLEIISFEIEP